MASSKNDRESRAARERLRVYEARQTVHRTRTRRRRLDNILAVVVGAVLVAGASIAQVGYFTAGPGAPKPKVSASASASASATPSASASAGQNIGDVPAASTAEGKSWSGVLTINGIAMDYTLDGAKAPQAVAVWLQAVKDNYYDNKTCHRVLDDSLIQCGSLTGDGSGDPDFQWGPVENAPSDATYTPGMIAMARGTSEYSMDHQFFIVTKQIQLGTASSGYTVLGKITSNLSTLATKIVDKGTSASGGDGAPVVKSVIDSVTIS